MLSKLPMSWALRLGLWLTVGGLVLGIWASKPVLAVEHMQTDDNTGRISGFVTNAEGTPVDGIQVTAYRYDYDPEIRLSWPYPWWLSNSNFTDSAGAYQIADLQPGIYTLYFSDSQENFAFEYYGDSVTLSHAMTITVAANQTTYGINATLLPGGAIRGSIHMYDGTPVSQVTKESINTDKGSASLYVQDGLAQEWIKIKEIRFSSQESHFDMNTSTFTFRGLLPGSYKLGYYIFEELLQYPYRCYFQCTNLFEEFYQNAETIGQAQLITLTAEAMASELNIVVGNNPSYGRIRGRVTSPQGVPLAGVAVQTFNLPRLALTDTDGNYELPSLMPGDYNLFFFDPNFVHVWSEPSLANRLHAPIFYPNKALGSDRETIHVITGTTMSNVDVVLPLGSQLTGKIRMFDGSIIDSSYGSEKFSLPMFMLRFKEPVENPLSSSSVSYQPYYDIATGTYTFGGLAEGTYVFEYNIQHKNVSYSSSYILVSVPLTIYIPAEAVTAFDWIIPENAKDSNDSIPNITGHVTDKTGTPLAGIRVTARDLPNGTESFTDENGNYGLYLAEPGSYTVSFSDDTGAYGWVYYGGTPARSQAAQIELSTDSIITGINATLEPASKVIGQATIWGGTPLSQVSGRYREAGQVDYGNISLTYKDGEEWQWVEFISLGGIDNTRLFASESSIGNYRPQFDMATNVYTFGGLPAGDYRLEFTAFHDGFIYGGYLDTIHKIPVPGAAITIAISPSSIYTNVNIVLGNDNQRVLALYALALDHDPDRIDNLAPQLAPAMQSIIAATRDQPNKTAVVLADAAGVGDTRIYVVRNGRATPVQGLPNAAFQLDPTATEANMADGVTLGNFIRWARNTYPAEVTLFGFVGHGAPLVPATGFETLVAASGGIRPRTFDSLFPLPTRVGAYPSLTDNHPQALITPYDLATALRIGSNNGADPLQIADVAHCFAASIEELYELSPDGNQPYAEIILASPTYTYLDPPALGQALSAINTLMTPARMADQILQTYDMLIAQADLSDGDAEVEHPRLLVAVNSRQVARVKQDWDKVAYHLLQDFDSAKIRQAYQASPHYDTTVCHPQDWALGPPDALADLYGFAAALVTAYGAESAVGQAATVVLRDLEDTAILSRYQRNGVPWYAPNGAPLWNFDNHKGIALFADLQGRPTAQPGAIELSWQTRWYTVDTLGGENPHPYAFVQNGFNGVTWATVFAEFWRRQPGVTIQTALCFPELASEPQTGELRISALSDPLTGTVRVGLPFTPTAIVQTDQAIVKPAVRFNLYDANQTLLLSDTVQGGYWLTGTHQLTAMRPFTPTAPGDLTLEVIVDPVNNVSEANEADNRLTQRYTVAPPDRFPLVISARLAEPSFFVNQKQVALHALVSPADSATTLVAQLYQFTNGAPAASWQPIPQARQTLDLARPTLVLNDLSPGVVVAHIWARTAEGYYSARPAVVIFNYAPANQPLAAGQTHHYWLATPLATALQLDLTGGADLFAWSPFNDWGPEWRMAGSPLILPTSALGDGYRLAVTTLADSQYTLTAQPTANPPTAANATPDLSQSWPVARPRLVQPVINPPGGGALVAGRHSFLPLVTR